MNKKTKRKVRPLLIIIIIILIPLTIIIGGYSYYNANISAVSKESKIVNFTVNEGDTANKVLNNLKEANIIKDVNVAKIFLKLNKLQDVKKGDYQIDLSWNLETILKYLNDSKSAIVNSVRITIVEGDWAKHIATKISESTNLGYEELMDYWNNENTIKVLMTDYPFLTGDLLNNNIRVKLEGYLFPETYDFYRETTVEDVTRKMLDQTLKIYNEYKELIDNNDLSIHEIFTLASIVQYEASKVDDMKNIAQVFYNRMNIGMKLQSSVTVCYAIDKEKEDDWKSCEVNPNYDSLYNTYMYQGLPPGPILNPGKAAIEAVLNPTNNDYLFFIADVYGDGTVYFAKTYEEHLKLVNKYLK